MAGVEDAVVECERPLSVLFLGKNVSFQIHTNEDVRAPMKRKTRVDKLPDSNNISYMSDQEPIINLQDTIGKIVGKRKAPESWEASKVLQQTGRVFQNRWGGGVVRGKVYRYNSFEEADQHLMESYIREKE